MVQVFVSLGSNIDKEANLHNGLTALQQSFGQLSLSSLFESDAVGFAGDSFYNMVIGFQTHLSLNCLANELRAIEIKFGRQVDAKKFSSRTLDLDILLYDQHVLVQPVQIPRHEITENAFVLWPLAELIPNEKHPVLGQSYQQLWQQFDKQKQQLRKVPFTWSSNMTELTKA